MFPELHWKFYNYIDDEYHLKSQLLFATKCKIVKIFDQGIHSDDLVAMIEKINEFLPRGEYPDVDEAVENAIRYEFSQTRDSIDDLSTEDELTEHIDFLTTLAKVTGYNADHAKAIVQQRIHELDEEEPDRQSASIPPQSKHSEERFSDDDLKSLFYSLIES